MNLHSCVISLPRVLASLAIILIAAATATTKPSHFPRARTVAPVAVTNSVTLNLSDFGAVGDGVTDNGPAFQAALDALAAAGGGILLIPAGTYLISSPVVKDFSTLSNGTITIQGVPSSTMPAPVTASGQDLSAGLNLTSEIIAATGPNLSAFTLTNAEHLTIEHIAFLGRPNEMTDAFITLFLVDIGRATIRHCEFYGLSSFGISPEYGGGNIVRAVRSDLAIELSVFLGCTANSGAYGPVVENISWRKFSISNSIFLDYGQRPGFFSKTGLGAPLSWIDIGNAAAPTPESPRREFLVRDTFLDEGGWVGITAFPYRWGPYVKIDLVYISGLKMNVPNMGTAGHRLYDVENLLIENSHYGWSHNAYAAIDINRTANAIFDHLTCIDHADRLRADAGTGRLTVINSQYAGLDSEAQVTTVLETAPEDDPVQYVRQQFLSVLARQPDPAAHFYWSDLLIRCGDDIDCRNEKRLELQEYLATTPNANFTLQGTAVDENGAPIPDAAVLLSGSQATSTLTDSQGIFRFFNLPTSGSYTVAVSKEHYSFATSSQTVLRPSNDVVFNFSALLNRHSISGQITRPNGTPVSGVTVQLDGTATAETTDANGYYSFSELAAGQDYTVIPSSTDYDFSPVSISFEGLSANQTADFVGNPRYVSFDGNVVDEDGRPISGATVNLSGTQSDTTITNLSGAFHLQNLLTTGTYTVTVSKRHYTFAIVSRTIERPQENVTLEFSARLNRHSISGRITRANGSAVSGVTVGLNQTSIAPVTTDNNGFYSFANLAAGQNYSVVASSSEFSFTPGSVSLPDLSADQTANFSANLLHVSFAISVVDENGASLNGATITVSGSQSANAQTDSLGRAQFSSLPTSGSYTLSVNKQHYSFTTSSQNIDRPTDNVSITFSGRLNRHSISGRITRADGAGLTGVTVRLGQAGSISAITDANGYYSFSDLPAGENYTVVPQLPALVFTPVNAVFDNLSDTRTANFVGKLVPELLTISGSDLAVALDAVSFLGPPFSVLSTLPMSTDGLTRVMVFARNVEQVQGPAQFSIVAEDEDGHTHPLDIEYVGEVRSQTWLKQVNVRLSPNLASGRCVKLRLSVAGISSNAARICIGPSR